MCGVPFDRAQTSRLRGAQSPQDSGSSPARDTHSQPSWTCVRILDIREESCVTQIRGIQLTTGRERSHFRAWDLQTRIEDIRPRIALHCVQCLTQPTHFPFPPPTPPPTLHNPTLLP